nr:cupredoxin domain-containing protein [Chloroflexia bacterium]
PSATPTTLATPGATPAATPGATPDAASEPSEQAIAIVDFSFAPATITVAPGTTVVWTNNGAAPHTVTGDFGDSGFLEPGQTFSFTFTDPGAYAYVCDLHPNMTAEIIVSP